MEIPPLSQRPITDEEEEAFLQSTQPRRGLFTRRSWGLGTTHRPRSKNTKENKTGTGFTTFDTTHNTTRTGGGLASWLRADPIDWGIRALIILLAIGALVAVYIQGEARGWWNQGTAPTAAPTRSAMSGGAPTPAPTGSGEAVMSGGYEIGPDGILVRPAEHAASTYTLPTLPQTATENTERGAEAAAEHYLAVATYAWNTGDTSAVRALSSEDSGFAEDLINRINEDYSDGWVFGHSLTVKNILLLEPVPANGADVPPNTIGVKFSVMAIDGTKCKKKHITVRNNEYHSTISLFMTWNNGQWIETQGRAVSDEN
ncbi:hypothetical protein I6H42_01505 [Schaalia meyeri]|uniref:DUF6318 domain-containing protein n=1 Tax=Schaalia meyeri TaxID=52773 RepID=A0AAP9Y796_9ACTO|nr:DUF6318 family protein [Schaalia meyeri]QQC44128.1 hypothetical protein I6H42_01505 [Schaalia meyeri]SDR68785.1 hypothetical protein SAMN04489715_0771 [Schaalia meyeri]